MVFSPINFLYFAIVGPVVIIVTLLIMKFEITKKHVTTIVIISLLLFFVRIMLVLFQNTIGVMPYIIPDIVFYSILTVFGVVFSTFFLLKVENKTFEDIGFIKDEIPKNILVGLLGFLPLIAMFPLLLLLTGIQINFLVTWDKILIGIVFGLILGGYYEEIMFRGIIQNHFMEITDEKYTIIRTAAVFVATHIGYLPLTGFGIMYVFLTVMALILSYFRLKFSQISCVILHGGIVFIIVLFI